MITAVFISFKIRVQKIREEKKLQYKKDNDQFEDDNAPELFTNSHVFKTLVIKKNDIP
jgi:hypothetical protein